MKLDSKGEPNLNNLTVEQHNMKFLLISLKIFRQMSVYFKEQPIMDEFTNKSHYYLIKNGGLFFRKLKSVAFWQFSHRKAFSGAKSWTIQL